VAAVEGVAVEVSPEAVWVRSDRPLAVLSSAPLGGELSATRHVVNMHVPRGYEGRAPAEDLAAFGRRLGLREPFVGLMTAAWTERAAVAAERADGVGLLVAATVGLSTPLAAGLEGPVAAPPSTINLVAVLDARLGRAAAVNGIATVTEAKVGALLAAGVTTPGGRPATGTVTDAVVLAWTGRGPELPFLGPGTPGGWLLARAVRRAVGEGIARGRELR
jgi:adenosylcobinamide amidohydrolase